MKSQLSSLYEGLKGILDGDDLLHALCIWQDQFDGSPTFAIKDYVKTIAPLVPPDFSQTQLHKKLASTLVLNGQVAKYNPLKEMNGFRVRQGLPVPEEKATVIAPHLAAFHALVLAVMTSLPPKYQQDLKKNLNQQGKKLRAGVAFNEYLEYLVLNQTHLDNVDVAEEKLSSMVDVCYQRLCSYLGPVAADRVFQQAIDTVKQKNTIEAAEIEALL